MIVDATLCVQTPRHDHDIVLLVVIHKVARIPELLVVGVLRPVVFVGLIHLQYIPQLVYIYPIVGSTEDAPNFI